jgi:hypothetical protein
MASPPVETKFCMPDPNLAPLNLIQLFQLANLLVHSEIVGDYITYVVGSDEPGAGDRDKVWFQKDTQGRPIAVKVWWNGHWRRMYNGMLGEVRGYTGNPGTDFDNTGMGRVTGEYDGWHLCNGKDGTPDLSDRFLIGAHMNNEDHSGYVDDEWVTWISNKTGMHTGGERDFTLTEDTTWRPATPQVTLYGWSATGNIPDNPGSFYGRKNVDSAEYPIVAADEGNLDPSAVSIIPPFIAMAWIIFVGYRT